MSRITRVSILVLLCLLFAAGMTPVMAMQAGKSSVYQFNVTILSQDAGKITINTADQHYVYNNYGVSTEVKFVLRSSCGNLIDPTCANPGGGLHFEGVWDKTCDLESATFWILGVPGSHCP
jgi:hypothetical protein